MTNRTLEGNNRELQKERGSDSGHQLANGNDRVIQLQSGSGYRSTHLLIDSYCDTDVELACF